MSGLTSPDETCHNIALGEAIDSFAKLGHFTDKITTQNGPIPKGISIEALDFLNT